MLPATFAATLAFLMIVCSQFSIGEAFVCKVIKQDTIDCSSTMITIDSKPYNKGQIDQRRKLSAIVLKEVQYRCGTDNGKLKWDKDANLIRVDFHDNGKVDWKVYKCDKQLLDASPTSAGQECSVSSKAMACPSGEGNICVYESDDFTYSETGISAGAQVEGSKLTEILKATGTLKGKLTRIREKKYKSKNYLMVPPGMNFCVNFDAESQENDDAPTGYEWRCSTADFVEKMSTGKCTNLRKCNHPSICSGTSVYLAFSASLITLAYTVYLFVI